MLLSMTGYGRANYTFMEKVITVEIRSLNSKITDLRFKIPLNYKEKEHDLRKIVLEKSNRGKVDVTISVQTPEGDGEYNLNFALFKKYFRELSQLTTELNMPKGDLLQAILRLPNVVVAEEDNLDDQEWMAVKKALNQAMEHFHNFRHEEGKAMENDMRLRISNIQKHLSELPPFEAERKSKLRQRLHQNLNEFLGSENVDENRFEQEVLFYIEKMDITEEKVRLKQHCKYFVEQLDTPETLKGRKLSFISQEMGREINTLGAKAYSSQIQRVVVKMKDELEKIKEQVANSV